MLQAEVPREPGLQVRKLLVHEHVPRDIGTNTNIAYDNAPVHPDNDLCQGRHRSILARKGAGHMAPAGWLGQNRPEHRTRDVNGLAVGFLLLEESYR